MAQRQSAETTGVHPWQQALWRTFLDRQASGKLAHAYLLHGDKGIGKLDFARLLAARLLCLRTDSLGEAPACGQCRSCQLLQSGTHPDLLEVCPEEGASAIKVDQIRQLTEFSQRTAHAGHGRVILIHPAEGMAAAPANALLKVLEEPRENTYFLLLSHQAGRVLMTVRSRCQNQLMPAPDATLLLQWLQSRAPGSTPDELQMAMNMTGKRPLLALEAVETGLPAQQRSLLQGLIAMLERRCLPTELAREHEKADRPQLLGLLLRNLAELTAIQLGRSQTADLGDEFDTLCSLLLRQDTGAEQKSQRARLLLNLYRRLQLILLQQQSGSNPNPLLSLEEVFLAWQAVGSGLQRIGSDTTAAQAG